MDALREFTSCRWCCCCHSLGNFPFKLPLKYLVILFLLVLLTWHVPWCPLYMHYTARECPQHLCFILTENEKRERLTMKISSTVKCCKSRRLLTLQPGRKSTILYQNRSQHTGFLFFIFLSSLVICTLYLIIFFPPHRLMVKSLQFSVVFACFMLWLPLEWNEHTQLKTQLFSF